MKRGRAWLLAGLFPGLLLAARLEVHGLALEGDDAASVLAVRDLAGRAEAAWAPLLGAPSRPLPGALLVLETTAGSDRPTAGVVRGLTAWVPWHRATSRRAVEEALVALALERQRQAEGWARGGGAWVKEALRYALAVEDAPLRADDLGPRRPAPPLRGLLAESEGGAFRDRERWVLAEALGALREKERDAVARLWRGESSGVRLEGLPVEVWWGRHWAIRQSRPRGPFLTLAESAARLRGLGQVDVRQRGVEARVWWYELPVAERARGSASREARRLHLGLLLPRVHPIYHSAAVALAGSLEDDAEAVAMGARFPALWTEAETLAEAVESLLRE